MSRLFLYHGHTPDRLVRDTVDPAEIAGCLAEYGVCFEQWPHRPLAQSDDVLVVYEPEIDRLRRQGGYRSVDVIRMQADHPDKHELRKKFLDEHIHTEDEVRFFVEGQALFYMRLKDNIAVVHCCAGDLISVPAQTPHWFDMGASPFFTAIRFFGNPLGWVAHYTGLSTASRFGRYDDYIAAS